jgi:hypothetical protein
MALPASPPAASAAATVAKRDDGPVPRIQDAAARWLDMLARGEDEKFLDEAIVPEQLDEVLGSRSKAELVADFERDKHADVVKVLTLARATKPDEVKSDGVRTVVTWENREGVRHVTFVIEGAHVWIKN